jgi:hypothetical protein
MWKIIVVFFSDFLDFFFFFFFFFFFINVFFCWCVILLLGPYKSYFLHNWFCKLHNVQIVQSSSLFSFSFAPLFFFFFDMSTHVRLARDVWICLFFFFLKKNIFNVNDTCHTIWLVLSSSLLILVNLFNNIDLFNLIFGVNII